jgi:AcrR family transcriptional regulator
MTNIACPRPRSQRTRDKLLNAFAQLVVTRGYLRVCPNDIAKRAGVGRSTLYTHFSGLRPLLEASLERPCRTLAGAVRVKAAASDLLPLLNHFREQAHPNAAFFADPSRSLWSSCLARAIVTSLRHDPDRLRHRPAMPRHLLGSVLADLQLAIIARWLAAPAGISAETIATTLTATSRRLVMGS